MKKVMMVFIVLVGLAMVIVAADFREIPALKEKKALPEHCVGFTIVEFDKAIDCHGDTVKIHRSYGFATLVEV